MSMESLRNQFLIAMPALEDTEFARTVSLMCEHGDDGALGLVINRPTDFGLHDMLVHLELDAPALEGADQPIFWGGPVQPERGFVLHDSPGDWDASITLSDTLAVTTSKDILRAIGLGQGPRRYLVALGYAGWDSGQLEDEMLDNAWLNLPSSDEIIFQTPPDERWEAATRLLGIDPSMLARGAGHA